MAVLRPSTDKSLSRRTFVKGAAVVAGICAITPILASCKNGGSNIVSQASPLAMKWKNTDLVGAVDTDTATDPKSDYHLTANRDWLAAAKVPDGGLQIDSFSQHDQEIQSIITNLLKGAAPDGDGVALARQLYSLCVDSSKRDTLGVEPLRPYLEHIESISTLSQLSTYLCFDEALLVDPLVSIEVRPDRRDRTRNAVYIAPGVFSLGDASEYSDSTSKGSQPKAADDTFATSALVLMGYTKSSAQTKIKNAYTLEQSIASFCVSNAEKAESSFPANAYNSMTLDALSQSAKRFPLGRMLSTLGFGADITFVIEQPDWLARMGVLFDQAYIDLFKDLLVVNTIKRYATCLDSDMIKLAITRDNTVDGTTRELDFTDNAYRICSRFLSDLLGMLFVQTQYSEDATADVATMASQARDMLAQTVASSSWLSSSARASAGAKLAAVTIYVAHPDEWPDFSDLTLPASSNVVSCCSVAQHHAWNVLGSAITRSSATNAWHLRPQDVTLQYRREDNTLEVPAGIIGGTFYASSRSASANRGALGVLMARELVHAIDENGSKYDSEGNANTWWTDDDSAAFDELSRKVADYYSSITVLSFRNEDGNRVVAEGIADIVGLQCMEQVEEASDKGHAVLLASFATLWRRQMSESRCDSLLSSAITPLGYLRTNVSVQQSSYFYAVMDVGEDDNMYLAPENRFDIW